MQPRLKFYIKTNWQKPCTTLIIPHVSELHIIFVDGKHIKHDVTVMKYILSSSSDLSKTCKLFTCRSDGDYVVIPVALQDCMVDARVLLLVTTRAMSLDGACSMSMNWNYQAPLAYQTSGFEVRESKIPITAIQ